MSRPSSSPGVGFQGVASPPVQWRARARVPTLPRPLRQEAGAHAVVPSSLRDVQRTSALAVPGSRSPSAGHAPASSPSYSLGFVNGLESVSSRGLGTAG